MMYLVIFRRFFKLPSCYFSVDLLDLRDNAPFLEDEEEEDSTNRVHLQMCLPV